MNNCYLWARWQLFCRGGYLISTQSKFGWWTHHYWTPDLVLFYEWVPEGRKRRRLWPPLLFRGYVATRHIDTFHRLSRSQRYAS